MNLSSLAFIGAPGPWELLVIGGIVLLLFGNRLPGAMRSLGRSVVEFKKGVKGIDEDEADSPAKASSEADRKSE
ncbi:MAG: twin-arginine translocase TatA/TatE family subunit [Planctomycetaceae bacterium]